MEIKKKEKTDICPKCGHGNIEADSCTKCGIIFSRYYANQRKKILLAKSEVRPLSGMNRFLSTIEKISLFYTILIIITIGIIIFSYGQFIDGSDGSNDKIPSAIQYSTIVNTPEGYTDCKGKEFFEQGLIAGGLKDIVGASRNFENALKNFSNSNDNRSIMLVTLNLADCYRILNRYEDSLKYFEDAQDIAKSNGLEKYEAKALRGVGLLYHDVDLDNMALPSLERALDIHQRLDLKKEAIVDCLIIGAIQNEYDSNRAVNYFEMALDMSENLEAAWFEKQIRQLLNISSDSANKTIRLTKVAPQFENF